jgi:segregation and condensation protein B
VEAAAVEQALQRLDQHLAPRGIQLQRKGLQVQLISMPEATPYIQRFLGLELTGRLTQPALETLAIIAYRQPVTRATLEAIRGVNCDGVLRTLVSRGLVEEVGRLDQAGRPILYGTTFEFLQYFGLRSLDELPPLEIADPNGPGAD